MSEPGESLRSRLDRHEQDDHQSSSTSSSVRTNTQLFSTSTTPATTPLTKSAGPPPRSAIRGPLQPSSLAMSFHGSTDNSQGILLHPNSQALARSLSSLPTAKRGSAGGDENDGRNAAVTALFGPAVGPCVGDFAASYCRVGGRLFAATRAIMFYSNLFGFERRLCLPLDEVEAVESYRSTSIRICMVDCEEYIFKRLLPHRDAVLDLLRWLVQRYKASEGGRRPMDVGAIQESWGGEDGPPPRRALHHQGSSSSLMLPSTATATWASEGGACSEDRPSSVDDRTMGQGHYHHPADSDDEDDGSAHGSFALRPRLSSDHTPVPSHQRQRNGRRHGHQYAKDEDFLIPIASDVTPNHGPTRRRSQTEPTFRTQRQAFPSFFYGEESSGHGATMPVQPIPSKVPMTKTVSRAVSEPVRSPCSETKDSIASLVNGSHTAGDGLTQDESNLDTSGEVRTRLFASNEISRSTVPAATSGAATPGPSTPPSTPPWSPPTLLRPQASSSNVDPEALVRAWKDAKKTHDLVALEATVLQSCTLDAFVELFFADDAPYSLAKYQTEHIGDKEVEFGPWRETGPPGPASAAPTVSWERSINYLHPLNNSVGPSQAKTTRQQRLARFGECGIILDNTTLVEGIPMADCFKVIDHWIVESDVDRDGGNEAAESCSSLTITVTFQIVFTKRTMFKSLIQKNIKSETKKWFRGYVEMLQRTLQEHPPKRVQKKTEVDDHVVRRDDVIATQDEHTQRETCQSLEPDHCAAVVAHDQSHGRVSAAPWEVIQTSITSILEGASAEPWPLDSVVKVGVCALLLFLAFQVAAMKQSLSNMERQLEAMQDHTAALLEVIQLLSKESRPESAIPNGCREGSM
jgi:hypothetical protein